jgi:galactokinase
VIAAGVAGHALLIDCGDVTIEPVEIPDDVDVVVQFVAQRALVASAYATRVAECATAESVIGPLRSATSADTARIADPVIRDRAQHVVTENQRVRDFAAALRAGDLAGAGSLMVDSHNSLRDLYLTSTPVMDAAVLQLTAQPGVYGARMTGGGFGGCVVALTRPGALADGWVVRAVDGAHRID